MKESILLTPVELFFLGTQMKAKYIDYAYIAAMPDIQKRYAFHESGAWESLEEKGFAEEDFGGDVTIDEEVLELLQPVFFSEKENVLKTKNNTYRFHVLDHHVVMTEFVEGGITFSWAEDEDIYDLLKDDLAVQSAHVEQGFRDEFYTVKDLSNPDTCKKIINILKGE